jgi:hypothetical protein
MMRRGKPSVLRGNDDELPFIGCASPLFCPSGWIASVKRREALRIRWPLTLRSQVSETTVL